MHTKHLIINLVLACVLSVLAEGRHYTYCATPSPPDDLQIKLQNSQAKGNISGHASPIESLTIPLFMHFVVSGNTPATVLSHNQVKAQLDVLQAAYAPHSIQFNLTGTKRYVNDTMAKADLWGMVNLSADRMNFLKKARRGDYDTLNLYLYSDMEDNIGGLCFFPEFSPEPQQYHRDGCHISAKTIPGSGHHIWNMGHIAVHEVGHWMGLRHTFDDHGRCSAPGAGDYVDDTPAQSNASWGCSRKVFDSCLDEPGTDAIHNYMNYLPDDCSSEFSPGQRVRMHSIFNQLRAGHVYYGGQRENFTH